MKVQRTRKHSEAPAVNAAAKRPGDVVLLESHSIQNNTVIRFQVHGLPIAQGSQRSWMVNGNPVITTTAKVVPSCRRLVADVAQRFSLAEPWEGAVGMVLNFG